MKVKHTQVVATAAVRDAADGAEFKLHPGSALGAPTPLQGPDNRFNDVAEDFQYQYVGEDHILSVEGTRIHEKMNLAASFGSLRAVTPGRAAQ